jgi:hypothetical protein
MDDAMKKTFRFEVEMTIHRDMQRQYRFNVNETGKTVLSRVEAEYLHEKHGWRTVKSETTKKALFDHYVNSTKSGA